MSWALYQPCPSLPYIYGSYTDQRSFHSFPMFSYFSAAVGPQFATMNYHRHRLTGLQIFGSVSHTFVSFFVCFPDEDRNAIRPDQGGSEHVPTAQYNSIVPWAAVPGSWDMSSGPSHSL